MTSTNRKPLLFMGNSYSDLKAFPAEARRAVGFNLDFLQRGFDPENWKPMKTVGAGVSEILVREASGAYRVIFLASHPEAIYVLHCFQKKTERTTQRDIDLAKARFKAVPKPPRK